MFIKKIIALVLFFCLSLIFVFGQQDIKIDERSFKKRANKVQAEIAWEWIKVAEEYYEAGEGTYSLALDNYLKAYRANSGHALLNYKIGVCYLYTARDFGEAVFFLEQAYEQDDYIAGDILILLGRAYQQNLQFDPAIEKYQAFFESLPSISKKVLKPIIDKSIHECESGKILIENPVDVDIYNVGNNINSKHDDYNSVIKEDTSVFYLTSRRENTTMGNRFPEDNKYYEDVYYAERINDEWQPAQNIGRRLNTEFNDAVIGLSPDQRLLFVSRPDIDGGSIYYSEEQGGKWSRPEPFLPKVISTEHMETTIAFSPDMNTFYFVSDRPEGIGGRDIYSCEKNTGGSWSKPKNMGPRFNTPYDEEAVFIDYSGDTMYFSSQGHNSMGGYDIFIAVKDDAGNWADPENLGYPINSPGDEVFFRTFKSSNRGYFTSFRDEGYGGLDIYEYEIRMPDKYMEGSILDKASSSPLQAKLLFIHDDFIDSVFSDEQGKYQWKIPKRVEYTVQVSAKNYMPYSDEVNTAVLNFYDILLTKDFLLEKVEVGAKVVLKNIYFEFNKATLKEASFRELENVIGFMKDNPKVKIKITGHTDNVGSRQYNLNLSQARAKSVVEHIKSKGIDPGRMEYKGYAFDQPIADNDTEEGRAQNRRVEFEIIGN